MQISLGVYAHGFQKTLANVFILIKQLKVILFQAKQSIIELHDNDEYGLLEITK